jgi:hypothetical protein
MITEGRTTDVPVPVASLAARQGLGNLITLCPVCEHLHDEQDPCRTDGCFCLVCLTCHGHQVIPAGGHDRRGEELERGCESCNRTGQR